MKLRYLKRALRQIDRVLSDIAQQSPQGAAAVESRLNSVLLLLLEHPHIGTRTRVPGTRRVFLAHYPYLVDYAVDGDEIVVHRFRHTARRPIDHR